MTRALTVGKGDIEAKTSLREVFVETYNRLASWAERHVEAGEDGLHIPDSVRRATQSQTPYL